MKERLKNFLSLVLRFGLSFALLAYLYQRIDVEHTINVVRSSDPKFIIYAFLLFVGINFIILFRWLIFIRAMGLQSPTLEVVRFFFIGLFGNLFLPSAIGGDVIKILGLCKNSSQKPKVVGSVLLDRLSGFAGMVIVATVTFLLGSRLIEDRSLIISISAMAGGSVLVAVILFHEGIYSFCCRIFGRLPKLKQALMNLHYDVALLKDRRDAIYKAVAVSCLSQVLLAVTFYLVARGLHQDVGLPYFLIFVPIICVVSTLPSIGGLGVREAGAAYLFAKVGVASGVAVSMSLVNFLFMAAVGLVGGVFFYGSSLYPRRIQHHSTGPGLGGREPGRGARAAGPVH